MKSCLICLFVCSLSVSYAQNIPFPGIGATWTQTGWSPWTNAPGDPYVQSVSDTVSIKGQSYMIVEDYLFRSEGAVWYWMHADSLVERIYMDWTLEVGDTLWCQNPAYPVNPDVGYTESVEFMVVFEIDSIIDELGETRSRWKMDNPEASGWAVPSFVVEGVGNTRGLLEHASFLQLADNGSITLVCFEDAELIIENPLGETYYDLFGNLLNSNYEDCWWEFTVDLGQIGQPELQFRNTEGGISIVVPGEEEGTITVHSSQGTMLSAQNHFRHQAEVFIPLPPTSGVYLISLITPDRVLRTKLFH